MADCHGTERARRGVRADEWVTLTIIPGETLINIPSLVVLS